MKVRRWKRTREAAAANRCLRRPIMRISRASSTLNIQIGRYFFSVTNDTKASPQTKS